MEAYAAGCALADNPYRWKLCGQMARLGWAWGWRDARAEFEGVEAERGEPPF
jgi:hypothetical protein